MRAGFPLRTTLRTARLRTTQGPPAGPSFGGYRTGYRRDGYLDADQHRASAISRFRRYSACYIEP